MKHFVIPSVSRGIFKKDPSTPPTKSGLVGMTTGIFLTFAFLLLTFYEVSAVTMDSTRFKIESANVTTGSGNSSSSGYKISDTLGQMAAGQFSSTGYVIKAGFQYLHSIIPFRFSISDTSIDFGTLIPNTSVTATTNLTVSFGGAGQYQVTAIEEGGLKIFGGSTIPDTSCNGGGDTCTESGAKIWNSSTAYGFGYGMSGDDIPADFIDSTYFRPFPDRTAAESPATIMTNINVGKNRISTLAFKVNISPIQSAGSYQTVINFVATPSF